jgi:16S rRNA (guanine527-N7)-methyltransferase
VNDGAQGVDEAVWRWLERSREVGFLGPGPVDAHVEHALGFAEVVGAPPTSVVDLGSGGGVPGLVLASVWPDTRVVLLDSMERRTAFLSEAVQGLGWHGRVEVVRTRAEVAGRDKSFRGWHDAVVSRSFGAPSVTAECAAPLLRVGGRLVVSEPPEETGERWPSDGLATLGLALQERRTATNRAGYAVLVQEAPCSVKFPRREGVPTKRPLW